MAQQDKPTDIRALKMQIRRQKREAKLRKKQLKRERKMKKLELKRKRKEARLRAVLARQGIKSPPPKTEAKEKAEPEKTEVTASEADTSKIPEAEIISEADKWKPKSARKLDEIQKMIDRMDRDGIKSMRERYKQRYGEDLEVPDIYETKASFDVETAEEIGELEPVTGTSSTSMAMDTTETKAIEDKRKADKKAKAAKKKKIKIDRPQRFFDFRTPWYLKNKLGANRGKAVRGFLLIFDIFFNILFFILIIKILTTIIYIIIDRRHRKDLELLEQESAQPQATS